MQRSWWNRWRAWWRKTAVAAGARRREAGSKREAASGGIRRALLRMARAHGDRSRVQRAFFGLVGVGVIVAIALSYNWSPFGGQGFDGDPGGAAPGGAAEAPFTSGGEDAAQTFPADGLAAGIAGETQLSLNQEDAAAASRETEGAAGQAVAGRFIPIPSVPAASVGDMLWPVDGAIRQPFGWYRHPVFGDWRHSSEVVLAPPADDDGVRAALAGRVREVVNEGGLWRISIEHAGGWETVYEGLTEIFVDSFTVVATGELVGRAAGPLPRGGVGFGIRREEVAVDPTTLIQGASLPVLASP